MKPNGSKLSQFTIFVPDGKEFLAYNTLTRALVSVGAELKEILTYSESPIKPGAERQIEKLRKLGIVVDSNVDESVRAQGWYDKLRFRKSVLSAVVLTTYDCNLACRYCIEDGVKKSIYMDAKGARRVADWLINRVLQLNVKRFTVLFYGGEPLLNPKPMHYIAERLHKFAREHNVHFGFAITTNGTALGSETVDKLLPYGLDFIKVTIDGDREAHNSNRPFKNKRGTFDVIIKNILQVIDKTRINITANVDSENLDSLPRMLDYFERLGIKEKVNYVDVGPIIETNGKSDISFPQHLHCDSPVDFDVIEALIDFKYELLDRGFPTNTKLGYTICGMKQDGGLLVFDPSGFIYTCPAFVGREGFEVGDVSHLKLGAEHQALLKSPLLGECTECAYFPMCSGGCRYAAYLQTGDYARIVCKREYYENITPKLIRFQHEKLKRKYTKGEFLGQ